MEDQLSMGSGQATAIDDVVFTCQGCAQHLDQEGGLLPFDSSSLNLTRDSDPTAGKGQRDRFDHGGNGERGQEKASWGRKEVGRRSRDCERGSCECDALTPRNQTVLSGALRPRMPEPSIAVQT
eukprot:779288-Rhodomonas_salina.1